MDYIYFIFRVLSVLFIVMVFTRLLMVVADFVGKEFGIGDFFINLWRKISNLCKKNEID